VHSLLTCIDDMIPVNPRKQAEYEFPILKNKDINEHYKYYNDSRFSLFMMSPRLAMIPRTIIDVKIIIIGASDCGVAFAEYLAMRYIYRLRY